MDVDSKADTAWWADFAVSFPWLVGIVAFGLWILIAAVAYLVAPRDRPGAFFWCTLFLLGPLGIVLALVAPARPEVTP